MMAGFFEMRRVLEPLVESELGNDPNKITTAWVRKHFPTTKLHLAVNMATGLRDKLSRYKGSERYGLFKVKPCLSG